MASEKSPQKSHWLKLKQKTTSLNSFVKEERARSHHEHVITELESSDGALGPTLRPVYESNQHEIFLKQLESRIHDHDKDIEKMCNFHYQGFVESITELLKVRADAEKLKTEVVKTNRGFQDSGRHVIERAIELRRCRIAQKNIAAEIEHLKLCLPVLEMYLKLNEQMSNKRYYPALKTLEQLEHTYLPRVSQYDFTQIMAANIPKLREKIKEEAKSDFVDFLESIRKHSDKIGEVAMKQVQKQRSIEDYAATRERLRLASQSPPTTPDNDQLNPFEEDTGDEVVEDEDEEDELISAQDLVDFSPVYRCLHIYSVIGCRDQFEVYYRRQREKQARLAMQPHTNLYDSLEGYVKYFHQILGFFVVEDHMLSTTEDLVSREYLDDLWEMAQSRILAVLRTNTAYCTDATLLLEIKHIIVFFCQTLDSYGYSSTKTFEFLYEIKDQYNEILMKRWVQVFRDIFDKDNYTAITVQTEQELERLTQVFPFHDEELSQASFPKTLPFSKFVPKTYRQIKEFIYACMKFSEDLNLSQTELDDIVRKSANLLLTRTLSGCLAALVRRPYLGLTELIQITVNMTHLENSCQYLENFISNITGAIGKNLHTAALHGTNIFKDARSEAEQHIYKKLNTKMDEFLELANYDWTLAESKGHASEYLLDLIAFMQSTFNAFTNLPGKVAQTACMSACKHLATSLMELLLDTDVKFVSMGALQQFELDLMQCEMFANREPVRGLKDGILQMVFLELRQLLDLFIHWDWSAYLADYGQNKNKYLRVGPHTAIILLEKMKDMDKKKNLFTFKKNERDRKKLLDTVLKQLRSLVNNQQT